MHLLAQKLHGITSTIQFPLSSLQPATLYNASIYASHNIQQNINQINISKCEIMDAMLIHGA